MLRHHIRTSGHVARTATHIARTHRMTQQVAKEARAVVEANYDETMLDEFSEALTPAFAYVTAIRMREGELQ